MKAVQFTKLVVSWRSVSSSYADHLDSYFLTSLFTMITHMQETSDFLLLKQQDGKCPDGLVSYSQYKSKMDWVRCREPFSHLHLYISDSYLLCTLPWDTQMLAMSGEVRWGTLQQAMRNKVWKISIAHKEKIILLCMQQIYSFNCLQASRSL